MLPGLEGSFLFDLCVGTFQIEDRSRVHGCRLTSKRVRTHCGLRKLVIEVILTVIRGPSHRLLTVKDLRAKLHIATGATVQQRDAARDDFRESDRARMVPTRSESLHGSRGVGPSVEGKQERQACRGIQCHAFACIFLRFARATFSALDIVAFVRRLAGDSSSRLSHGQRSWMGILAMLSFLSGFILSCGVRSLNVPIKLFRDLVLVLSAVEEI